MKCIRRIQKALNMELREHKSSFRVYTILRLLAIGVMVIQFYNRNFEGGLLCVLTLVLLRIPSFIQVTLKVEFPTVLEISLLLFIFLAEILGEIHEFYVIFPFWDTILHTLNGFLMAAIGLSLVSLLNSSEKMIFQLSPLFAAIVAFCFSMTIGVVWEIFEFGMDQIFALDMQKDEIVHRISSVMLDPAGGNTPGIISGIQEITINGKNLGLGGYLDIGLIDTMYDLIVNLVGATIFSIIGYFYVKKRDKDSFTGKLVPRKKSKEKDFWQEVKEADK